MKRTLIILSLILVITTGYITWWMLFNNSINTEVPINLHGKIVGYASLSPMHQSLYDSAKYASIFLFCLSITMAIIVFLKSNIAQIILGVFVTAIAIFISIYGFPTEYISNTPINGVNIHVIIIPDTFSNLFTFIIVLAVIIISLFMSVTSVINLIKSRKMSISKG
jgi:hypothetical protein